MRWVDAAQTAAQGLAGAAGIVMVGDRENDTYQGFTRRPFHHASPRAARLNKRRALPICASSRASPPV
jgi:hypothetical protein